MTHAMYPWNCCRICLSLQSLNTIFRRPEHSEKYSNAIFIATGIKIEIKDDLPQQMCSLCINFINESVKFHKKAEQTQKKLLERVENKEFHNIKVETADCKLEDEVSHSEIVIDVPEDADNDFKDYDDNIPLDTYPYYNDKIVKVPTPLILEYRENIAVKSKRKVLKSRKKDGDKTEGNGKGVNRRKKGEKVKEEIECEYCHKILTSRLSLRNHYKIHTGFDVVCEHCGKKFITRRLLLMHCRAKHGYEKTDKCSFCDYKASNAEQVKIHERLHTGEKPYVCKECSTGFHRKSSYLQHIAIHLPEKNVQCDQCPARFKSVTLMRIHKNRHRAPQYTFRCRICDNNFARRRNVARHLQRVHGLPADSQDVDRVKIA
ncbi:zinc finger protein 184-like [Achroia grisella]|uniref:zinc finger protein 184-like n=1 Tax=Achroia grisella TaxID=688607 RepID=UPI0027D2201B|nr:zinc finger protein 184-like [Achroia grisella]